jgi:hypothetical protein
MLVCCFAKHEIFPMSTREICSPCQPTNLLPMSTREACFPRDLFPMSTREICCDPYRPTRRVRVRFPCRPARFAFVFHVGVLLWSAARDLFPVSTHEACLTCRLTRLVSHFDSRDLFSHETCFPCRPTRFASHVGPRGLVSMSVCCCFGQQEACFPCRPTRRSSHVDPRDLFPMLPPPNFDTPLIATRHV